MKASKPTFPKRERERGMKRSANRKKEKKKGVVGGRRARQRFKVSCPASLQDRINRKLLLIRGRGTPFVFSSPSARWATDCEFTKVEGHVHPPSRRLLSLFSNFFSQDLFTLYTSDKFTYHKNKHSIFLKLAIFLKNVKYKIVSKMSLFTIKLR